MKKLLWKTILFSCVGTVTMGNVAVSGITNLAGAIAEQATDINQKRALLRQALQSSSTSADQINQVASELGRIAISEAEKAENDGFFSGLRRSLSDVQNRIESGSQQVRSKRDELAAALQGFKENLNISAKQAVQSVKAGPSTPVAIPLTQEAQKRTPERALKIMAAAKRGLGEKLFKSVLDGNASSELKTITSQISSMQKELGTLDKQQAKLLTQNSSLRTFPGSFQHLERYNEQQSKKSPCGSIPEDEVVSAALKRSSKSNIRSVIDVAHEGNGLTHISIKEHDRSTEYLKVQKDVEDAYKQTVSSFEKSLENIVNKKAGLNDKLTHLMNVKVFLDKKTSRLIMEHNKASTKFQQAAEDLALAETALNF
ncbi:MAG: hypothetical protein HOI80_05340 [Alphaproteobacteria bacterium]|nr:hypothetical protein [Alphaproteobacteria bacterium]